MTLNDEHENLHFGESELALFRHARAPGGRPPLAKYSSSPPTAAASAFQFSSARRMTVFRPRPYNGSLANARRGRIVV